METARSVIDCAFCFDAVVFGGYVRDVIVCQSDTFKDIDILWLEGDKEFQKFMKVLHSRHRVTCYKEMTCTYGRHMKLKRFRADDVLVDVVMYDYSFDAWKSNDLCDMSCNLFYMTRKIHLGIRYVPSFLAFTSDPMSALLDMARKRRYRVIDKNCENGKVTKVLYRCLDLAARGWMHEDSFSKLGVLTPHHRRVVKNICDIERDKVTELLSDELSERIYDALIDNLYPADSDGGSEDDGRSVNQENTDDDSLNQG